MCANCVTANSCARLCGDRTEDKLSVNSDHTLGETLGGKSWIEREAGCSSWQPARPFSPVRHNRDRHKYQVRTCTCEYLEPVTDTIQSGVMAAGIECLRRLDA